MNIIQKDQQEKRHRIRLYKICAYFYVDLFRSF